MMQTSLFDAAPAPPPEWPEGWDRGTLLADHVWGTPSRRTHTTEYAHASGVKVRWTHVWDTRPAEYLGARLSVYAKHIAYLPNRQWITRFPTNLRFLPDPVGPWAPIHEVVARLNQEPAP
jgi:hypothetical protein